MTNAYDLVWDIADSQKGDKTSEKPPETTENTQKVPENLEISTENDLFRMAATRMGINSSVYGLPENSFPLIADLWGKYLGISLHPSDVPAMMIMLKLARHRGGHEKRDNWVDIAGYAYCGDKLSEAKDGQDD